LNSLWSFFSKRRKIQFGLLLILMLFTSLTEIISIGAILPFLAVLTSPDRIFEMPIVQPFIKALKIDESNQLLLALTIIFCLAALTAGTMRLVLLWASTRLSFATGADLSINIYRRTLYQSYAVHCSRNSSEVIDGITGKANSVIYGIVNPALTFISSVVMIIAILMTLLLVEPAISLAAITGFSLVYIVIISLTRKKLLADGKRIAYESTQVIKALQEGLGGIRDVLIDGSQETYCQIYSSADYSLRRAQGNSLFISASPRYGMEALGMILIATFAYFLTQQDDSISDTIPILGTLALAAQRLLPLLQQAYGSWTQISTSRFSLQDTLRLLGQPFPDYFNRPPVKLPFNKSITLKQLKFRYGEQLPYVLNQLNLIIVKGSRVGFIGTTGTGKSTLLDIIMGLLQPTSGQLEIDGQPITSNNCRAWQSHIAHVPQTIFLVDGTIEENIAFGVSKDQINHSRVEQAAHLAQISESIKNLPKQYQTYVGERGVRLSGGQRQRIGIARALYKQADVLILDEATSALDSETEEAVMQSIEGLNKNLTVLIIAHRVTTLKNCTQIIELNNGFIRRNCTYQDILDQSQITIQKNQEF
jgi:ATP-binding cassette, subfamily B, bacterial PglK